MSSVLAHGCAASAMMKAICFANSSFEGILKGSPTPRLASSSPSDRGVFQSGRKHEGRSASAGGPMELVEVGALAVVVAEAVEAGGFGMLPSVVCWSDHPQ